MGSPNTMAASLSASLHPGQQTLSQADRLARVVA